MAYKYHYDPEADILGITLNRTPYDHAVEMGDFIIHVSHDDQPVYLEILNARRFLSDVANSLPTTIKNSLPSTFL